MEARIVKPRTVLKREHILNKNKLSALLAKRNMKYKELWRRMCMKYGFKLSYKGFMALIDNNSSWKLSYADAMGDILDIDYREFFEWVEIESEVQEWDEKHNTSKNRQKSENVLR